MLGRKKRERHCFGKTCSSGVSGGVVPAFRLAEYVQCVSLIRWRDASAITRQFGQAISKRLLSFVAIVLLVCGATMMLMGCTSDENDAVEDVGISDTDVEEVSDIDDQIRQLVSSSEFTEMDISQRREKAGALLETLQLEGRINNVWFDEDSNMYSYSYLDGSAGSIRMEKFKSYMN